MRKNDRMLIVEAVLVGGLILLGIAQTVMGWL